MAEVKSPVEPLRGAVTALTEAQAGQWMKVLVAGKPKSAGKTTFVMTGPGKKLHLAYDGGEPPLGIPGVDASQVWTVQYSPSLQVINTLSDSWQRPKNIGEEIFNDVQAIRNAFIQDQEVITFADGQTCPLPDLLILDGITEMTTHVLDWVCAINKKADPEEFANNFYPWRKRLDITRGIINMLSPLPCHLALVLWEAREMTSMKGDNGKNQLVPTGKMTPDGGGKLDEWLPGKMYSAVRCHAKYTAEKVRYVVQLKPDGVREWIGVRGRYDDVKEIDVTIDPRNPVSSWERVFGERGMKVRQRVEAV